MDVQKKLMEIQRQFLLNKTKKKFKKYEEQKSKISDLNRSVIKNSDDDDEKYMKIKYNSDDT